MKRFRFLIYFAWIAFILLPVGCGPKGSEGKKGEHEESPSGASFKPGKGVILTEETRKILELEIADVAQEKLHQVVRFNVQVFGETHRFAHPDMDHTGCDIHGSGFLPPERVVLVEPKQAVKLLTAANEMVDGFVVAVQKT